MTVATFWSNDPLILFNKTYINQLWPTANMTFEEKLNAITRVVLILSILGFIFTMNSNILIIGLLTIAIIYSMYRLRKQNILKEKGKTFWQNIYSLIAQPNC